LLEQHSRQHRIGRSDLIWTSVSVSTEWNMKSLFFLFHLYM